MRATFAATTAAALTVLLTGCGSTTPPTPPSTDAAPAPQASATSSAPASEPPQPASGELSVDEFLAKFASAEKAVKTFAMEMTMTAADSPGLTATGVVDQSSGTMNQHMTMNIMEQDMEVIMLDGTVYMRMPALGDDWYRMTPEQAQGSGVELPGTPSDMLRESRDAFDKVELIGTEEIRGVTTDRYRITLAAEVTEGEMGIPLYEVWLDQQGFTRKVLVEVSGGDSDSRIEMITDKINEPVSIKAPEKWVDMPS